jgi:hypothetical protein
MFSDILKYGWENIAHEILCENLPENDAKEKERELIASYGVCGRQKTYNSQYAMYKTEGSDWIDLIIDSETVKRYGNRFRLLDDYWLEPYIQQVGSYPFGTDLSENGIIIHFYTTINNRFTHKTLSSVFPRKEITFKEAYEWLNTAPNLTLNVLDDFEMTECVMNMLKEEHEPILKD